MRLLFSALAMMIACGGKQAAPEAAASDPTTQGEARDATPESLNNWKKLGERNLREDTAHESIRVAADEGRLSSVRFVIKFGKLQLDKVTVTYEDGSTFTMAKNLPFGSGVLSRAIDLPGERKTIRQIDWDYSGVRSGRSTQLEVWGQ